MSAAGAGLEEVKRQLREGINFWAGGTARFGERDLDGSLEGFDFSTSGLTLGLDRRIAPGFVVGAALGAARDKSRIDREGTESRAKGFSGALYASWQSAGAYLEVELAGAEQGIEIGACGLPGRV